MTAADAGRGAHNPTTAPAMRDRRALRAREAEVLRLRLEESLTFRDIGRRLSMDPSHACKVYRRALQRDVPATIASEARAAELDRLDLLEQVTLEVLRATHYAHSFGKVAKTDAGELLVDHGPTLAAVRELRELGRRRAAILGSDPPRRQTISVITEDALDVAIKQLEAELAAMGPA